MSKKQVKAKSFCGREDACCTDVWWFKTSNWFECDLTPHKNHSSISKYPFYALPSPSLIVFYVPTHTTRLTWELTHQANLLVNEKSGRWIRRILWGVKAEFSFIIKKIYLFSSTWWQRQLVNFCFFFMCVDKNLGMFIMYQTVRIV